MTAAVTPDLDRLAIDTIRTLSIDGVQQANSGHPGAPMGAAPMAYALWTRFLRHAPTQPGLAGPRPLRAVRRPRQHAALLAPPPDRLRPLARRPQGVPPVGLAHAGPPGVRPDARASRRRPARSARASPTRSAWPSPSAAWRPSSTATSTRSSTTGPTSSLRRRPPGGHRVRGREPRRPPAPGQAHRPVRRQPHPARRADVDGLVGGRARALRRLRLAHPAGRRTATTSAPIEAAIEAARARRPAEPHRGPDAHRLRQPEQAGLAEGARRAARPGRGPPDQGGLRLGPGQARSTCPDDALARVPRGRRRPARTWSRTGTSGSRRTPTAHPRLAATFRRRLAGELADGWDADLKTYETGDGGRDPQRLPGRDPGTRGPGPGAVRRRGRPVRIEPDRRQGRAELQRRRARPEPALRRPRARAWAASPTASPTTAGSSRTTRRS